MTLLFRLPDRLTDLVPVLSTALAIGHDDLAISLMFVGPH